MTARLHAVATTLLTALAPAIWGSTYIVTTELLPPDRPLTAAALRALPAGVLLLLYSRQRPALAELPRLYLIALLNIGLFQALLFFAAYRLPGGAAAVLGAVQPVFVMGLAWACDGRRPAALAAGAGAVGIAGMALLMGASGMAWDAAGSMAALLGALSMAAGTYLSRRWFPATPVAGLTGWQLLLGGATLAPLALLREAPLPPLAAPQVLGYAYLSLAGALLAYSLWFNGVRKLSPVAVSSLGLLSPVTAVVLGWAMLGQALRPVSFAGLCLVLGSVLCIQRTAPSPT